MADVRTPCTKADLRREIPAYRARRGVFDTVTVPSLRYLAIDGQGDPNASPAYADAVRTIYPVAYALKMASRRAGRDYVVMPLEALWWSDDMDAFTVARDKARWRWTLLQLVPDWLGDDDVEGARAVVAGKDVAPALDLLRPETLDEGLCVQTLHVGPYDAEGPVLEALHAQVIPELGFRMTGRHHEIYLGDPRRSAPERLRTILRQPVAPG